MRIDGKDSKKMTNPRAQDEGWPRQPRMAHTCAGWDCGLTRAVIGEKKKEIFQIVADKGGHIWKLLVRLNHRDWTSLPRLTVHIWSNPLDDAILIRWIFSSALPAISIL